MNQGAVGRDGPCAPDARGAVTGFRAHKGVEKDDVGPQVGQECDITNRRHLPTQVPEALALEREPGHRHQGAE